MSSSKHKHIQANTVFLTSRSPAKCFQLRVRDLHFPQDDSSRSEDLNAEWNAAFLKTNKQIPVREESSCTNSTKDSFSDLLERCKTVKISFICLPYTMTKSRSLEWNASHECTATARLDFPDFPQIFPPDIFRARVHFCNRKPHVNKMGAALSTFDFSDFSFF